MSNPAAQTLDKIRGFKVPNIGKIPALLKREFLDSKTGFVLVPMVVAGFTIFAMILGLISLEYQFGDEIDVDLRELQVTVDGETINGDDWGDDMNGENFVQILGRAVSGATSAGILMVMPFVIFFGLLSSLYDDRRDRSFLFWKSMPVSDTKEVLTKLGYYAIVGPMMLFGFMLALGFIAMLVVTPFIWYHGGSALDLLWGPTPFISMWFGAAANYIVYALWILPLLAWLMLASAFAPKAPMIFAIVPVGAIITVEVLFNNGQTYLAEALLDRIALDYAHIMGEIIEKGGHYRDDFEVRDLSIGDAFRALGASFANTKFWIGQLFTGAFMAGAIYLRRYKV
jgi:ABC-2 type transport system permease protein